LILLKKKGVTWFRRFFCKKPFTEWQKNSKDAQNLSLFGSTQLSCSSPRNYWV